MQETGPVRTCTRMALLAAILLSASGCATLSESQCIASDWETVGYTDGAAGRQSSQLLRHQNACVKHGVIPDREAYLAGWNDGVRQFCQPENAFSAGEGGRSFANVCPEDMQAAFSAAYQEGRQLYLAQSEIDNLNRQIVHKEARLKEIEEKMRDAEARLVADEATAAERMSLLDETKSLAQEQGQLEAEVQNMKVDAAVKAEQLKSLRQSVAYTY
ncbi:MAG: DUF2799 domain-containing protein [Pseudomonadales bacterium]